MEKLNRYTCQKCGGSIITVERCEGVTPMLLNCRATPGCDDRMASAMYRGVTGKPTHEWCKPIGRALRKLSPEMQDYIQNGGLSLRKIA